MWTSWECFYGVRLCKQILNYYFDHCVSLNVCLSSIAWHATLGHIRQDIMNRLIKVTLLDSLSKVDLITCEHCVIGKITRKPFGKAIMVEFSL